MTWPPASTRSFLPRNWKNRKSRKVSCVPPISLTWSSKSCVAARISNRPKPAWWQALPKAFASRARPLKEPLLPLILQNVRPLQSSRCVCTSWSVWKWMPCWKIMMLLWRISLPTRISSRITRACPGSSVMTLIWSRRLMPHRVKPLSRMSVLLFTKRKRPKLWKSSL